MDVVICVPTKNGTLIDKYFNIIKPSAFPGNKRFIIGSAIKNKPKKHGIETIMHNFIVVSIFCLTCTLSLRIYNSEIIGIIEEMCIRDRLSTL